jgi:hypothetical protein
MQLINIAIRSYFSHRDNRINNLYHYPFSNQAKWLTYLDKKGVNTVFGKEHNVEAKMSYSQFAERIPLYNYNSLFPYIERIIRGEDNILWSSKIKWAAKSSGTSDSKSKFIPVSHESLVFNNYISAQDSLTFYTKMVPGTKIFGGKGITLGGCFQDVQEDIKVKCGDVSAILLDNMPLAGDFLRASNRKILLNNNWNEKLNLLAKSTQHENITSLSGVPSWMLLVLKEVLRLQNKENILEVWPNLEVFFHGGVSFSPYYEEYKKIIPEDKFLYLNMYNASEGFFGLQDQLGCNELLLLTDNGVFYEFIPMDEVGHIGETAIPLEDVKLNQNYALVITTPAGLWRYIIGDTVQFTSLNPFRFKITGRTTHFINAFGEEVIVDNADKAINNACKKTGANYISYTAAPIFLEKDNSKACHEWVIEFTTLPSDLELFGEVLDETLKSLNSDYETKRTNDLILKKPKIHVAKPGTFIKWLENNNKLGGQHKVPHLQNNRKIIEEVLSLLEN